MRVDQAPLDRVTQAHLTRPSYNGHNFNGHGRPFTYTQVTTMYFLTRLYAITDMGDNGLIAAAPLTPQTAHALNPHDVTVLPPICDMPLSYGVYYTIHLHGDNDRLLQHIAHGYIDHVTDYIDGNA